jgi:hypothetical protein
LAFLGRAHHRIGIFDRHGQWLLAKDVFARSQGAFRAMPVEVIWNAYGDRVNVSGLERIIQGDRRRTDRVGFRKSATGVPPRVTHDPRPVLQSLQGLKVRRRKVTGAQYSNTQHRRSNPDSFPAEQYRQRDAKTKVAALENVSWPNENGTKWPPAGLVKGGTSVSDTLRWKERRPRRGQCE